MEPRSLEILTIRACMSLYFARLVHLRLGWPNIFWLEAQVTKVGVKSKGAPGHGSLGSTRLSKTHDIAPFCPHHVVFAMYPSNPLCFPNTLPFRALGLSCFAITKSCTHPCTLNGTTKSSSPSNSCMYVTILCMFGPLRPRLAEHFLTWSTT